jgi:hypothetical protein
MVAISPSNFSQLRRSVLLGRDKKMRSRSHKPFFHQFSQKFCERLGKWPLKKGGHLDPARRFVYVFTGDP